MTDTILVSAGVCETRVALISNDVATEIHFFRQFAPSIINNIYFARLRKVAPEFAGAFVEIEPGTTAFLPDRKGRPPLNLAEGAGLVVQITKEATGDKPPEATLNISLKSRLLTFLPASTHIEIAKAIPADRKATLLELCQSLTGGKAGVRVRSAATSADTCNIEQEYATLSDRWALIQSAAQKARKPHCIWQSPNPALEFVTNNISADTQTIMTDRAGMLADLKSATGFTNIRMHNSNLFDIANVEADIDSIMDTRIPLKGGGWLKIEETEALTAIDVNAGAPQKSRPFDETVYETNLTAAGEIVRQLRLRQIGGLVVIDFINMKSKAHIANVLSRLDDAIGTDPAPIRRTGFSAFGLIELTRKKTGPSLTTFLTRKTALAPTVETLVLNALRQAEQKGMNQPGGSLTIELSPPAAHWLKIENAPLVTELAQRTGAIIKVEANPDMAPDIFSVYAE